MTGRICGTGSCVPSFAMDNNDIAKLVDTSDEWIRERTGVVRRHIIREETTVSMAAEAGRHFSDCLRSQQPSQHDLDRPHRRDVRIYRRRD